MNKSLLDYIVKYLPKIKIKIKFKKCDQNNLFKLTNNLTTYFSYRRNTSLFIQIMNIYVLCFGNCIVLKLESTLYF